MMRPNISLLGANLNLHVSVCVGMAEKFIDTYYSVRGGHNGYKTLAFS
jgi:hypothetical protein